MAYKDWQMPHSDRRWRIHGPDGLFWFYLIMTGLEIERFKTVIACAVDYGFHRIDLA